MKSHWLQGVSLRWSGTDALCKTLWRSANYVILHRDDFRHARCKTASAVRRVDDRMRYCTDALTRSTTRGLSRRRGKNVTTTATAVA